ncbi:uncharacterized protein NMK_2437 [Novimethylophilus kurashikiensis]|uniref:DUF2182 domain-containing protein n=1 Tax=Novimethylophilus kurashikiensis TaxID=1825523 RepID=A0A2R5F9E6_9PROT|nr:hypothetical protein [Novimethylophilus kurashikiensis]GBG14836.1 uncharacterized protein NMK_2437 [Novimethylophilus kurashikiensis]
MSHALWCLSCLGLIAAIMMLGYIEYSLKSRLKYFVFCGAIPVMCYFVLVLGHSMPLLKGVA